MPWLPTSVAGTTLKNNVKILVVDVGGTRVKIRVSGHEDTRKCRSGPEMTASQMVESARELAGDWHYDVVSVGFPGPVRGGKPLSEPKHLGGGWVGFDFEAAFERPVKVINDAAMQALGAYEGGSMLFLGLGTGLGSALIVEGVVQPMELAHLPYKDGMSYEEFVGIGGLERLGKAAWKQEVATVVGLLSAALGVDYVVLGGGNVKKLDTMPPGARRGSNADAFTGGFRLWEQDR